MLTTPEKRSPEWVRLPEGRSPEVDMSHPIQGTLCIIYQPLDRVKWKDNVSHKCSEENMSRRSEKYFGSHIDLIYIKWKDRISKDEGRSPEVPK
jgi:hypothetical protein